MKIGRYEIKFGRTCWIQTRGTTTFWRFLFFVGEFKEAKLEDIDKKPQFPLGSKLEQEGRTYRYWKGTEPLRPGEKER